MTSPEQLILNLAEPRLREKTLSELSKIRDRHPDLALLLWDSFGTITVLLQETIAVYPFLSPPDLSAAQSTRACHALILFQCVASHPKTRMPFLLANLPFYLYPFLKTTSNTKPFEYLRLTALGVIGAIVKVDDPEVITFLLTTEIIPLCLRNMENGTELSQTVATFIVEKTLIDDVGLRYICSTAERCYAVCHVLGRMVQSLADFQHPSQRLLKHITRCYLRLSDNDRALWILWHCLPASLKDGTFIQHLDDDEVALGWLLHLLHKVNATPEFSESDANLDCTAGGKK